MVCNGQVIYAGSKLESLFGTAGQPINVVPAVAGRSKATETMGLSLADTSKVQVVLHCQKKAKKFSVS